jgi:soluble lytic murein transglycosylase-like protein
LIVVSPIVERGFKASGASYDIGKAMQLLYTSGGAGLAGGAIIGAATGDTEAGILGALTLRALATPKGQNLVGKLATNLSKAMPKQVASASLGDLVSLAGKSAPKDLKLSAEQPASSDVDIDAQIEAVTKEIEALQGTTTTPQESVKVDKQNISIPQGEEFAPPTLVKAVMQVESAGKSKAVSPKGAAGLMQLMPSTAKDLGVTDRFDPQQNVEGGSKYLQQQLSKFGDSKLALAAYNWGPDNLQRAIARTKKAGLKPTWENILDTVFVPKETQKYVNKVLTIQSALA